MNKLCMEIEVNVTNSTSRKRETYSVHTNEHRCQIGKHATLFGNASAVRAFHDSVSTLNVSTLFLFLFFCELLTDSYNCCELPTVSYNSYEQLTNSYDSYELLSNCCDCSKLPKPF